MSDVSITLTHEGRTVTVSAMSLVQARSRIAVAWPQLFEPGPESEAAALEVVMTEVVESLAARKSQVGLVR